MKEVQTHLAKDVLREIRSPFGGVAGSEGRLAGEGREGREGWYQVSWLSADPAARIASLQSPPHQHAD